MNKLKYHIKVSCIKCRKETTTGILLRYHKDKCPSLKRIRIRNKIGEPILVRVAWNKGMTKSSNTIVAQYASTISNVQKAKVADGTFIPNVMGIQARKNLSEQQSLRNRGGKSKWFEVNGIKLQGTWERNLALKFIELGIKWIKPTTNNDVWKYKQDNKEKSYAPDFYLPDLNIWLEVKGYWWGRDKEKMDIIMKTYPHRKIIILEKEQYEKILKNDLCPLN